MDAHGVITIAPSTPAEAFALKHWAEAFFPRLAPGERDCPTLIIDATDMALEAVDRAKA